MRNQNLKKYKMRTNNFIQIKVDEMLNAKGTGGRPGSLEITEDRHRLVRRSLGNAMMLKLKAKN